MPETTGISPAITSHTHPENDPQKEHLSPTNPILLFKYGGNAMTDSTLQIEVLHRIALLKSDGYDVVIVHGGGPFIKEALSRAGIQSEFIDGHRITTPEAYAYVEMALKGQVNSTLTGILNNLGFKAVGLSGKDAHMVTAAKRWHYRHSEKGREQIDIGLVGDVKSVDTSFINLLLQNDIIPVITCLAAGDEGNSYNINGDMFAGHIAGALGAREYIILTDVDGLLRDISDPASLISDLRSNDIHEMIRDGVIAGGMLPKIESCTIALKLGCAAARIINGTQPDQINNLPQSGTRITL